MEEPGDDALADLRGHYRGNLPLDDVVLWRRDPQATGSNGSRGPVARARDLAPLIYSRAAGPEEERRRDSAAAEAEALLAGWAADSAALDAAIAERGQGQGDGHPAQLTRPRRARSVPRGRIALLAGAGALALVVLVTVAVIARPAAPVSQRAEPTTSTPTPSPSTARPTATPRPLPPPPPVLTPTPVPEETDFRPDYFDQDIFSVLQVPINGGPIDNANGVAKVDDYGVPLSYVVANGDVFELIAKRFDIGTTYLASINAVRRENPTELFVGDTLNLGATTIMRIGDQNGVVYNFTDRLPDPHLPQE